MLSSAIVHSCHYLRPKKILCATLRKCLDTFNIKRKLNIQ
jgi:hypothetical protein